MSKMLSFTAPREAWLEGFSLPLLRWYDASARDLPWRREPEPYRVWVSEIMLQQTRVEAALPYFLRFMQRLPSLEALAEAPLDELYKLWEGLGYYSRVRNMQKAALILLEQYGGRFPRSVQELRSLPGIGEYTAGAILSIAFGLPVPAVDGNVLRVLSRAALSREDITQPAVKRTMTELAGRILPSARPGDFNQALMDLGSGVCRPRNPLCPSCPVREACSGYAAGEAECLPCRPPKKEKRLDKRTILLIVSPDGVLLHRRPEKGLLAGMWEYPGRDSWLSLPQVRALFPAANRISQLTDARHIFTHVEWHMRGYLIRTASFGCPEDCVWAGEEDVYALPSAFKTYTALLDRLRGSQTETISGR